MMACVCPPLFRSTDPLSILRSRRVIWIHPYMLRSDMTQDVSSTMHIPVLLEEAMNFLRPTASGSYCDATLGAGGHARAILERSQTGRVVGLDRDAEVLEVARKNLAPHGDRIRLIHARFSQIRSVLEQAQALPVDGCIADLGVSSIQLDQADRGFSFRRSGPLDMRMDRSGGETAAESPSPPVLSALSGLSPSAASAVLSSKAPGDRKGIAQIRSASSPRLSSIGLSQSDASARRYTPRAAKTPDR